MRTRIIIFTVASQTYNLAVSGTRIGRPRPPAHMGVPLAEGYYGAGQLDAHPRPRTLNVCSRPSCTNATRRSTRNSTGLSWLRRPYPTQSTTATKLCTRQRTSVQGSKFTVADICHLLPGCGYGSNILQQVYYL